MSRIDDFSFTYSSLNVTPMNLFGGLLSLNPSDFSNDTDGKQVGIIRQDLNLLALCCVRCHSRIYATQQEELGTYHHKVDV
jgi:hypothetical protein